MYIAVSDHMECSTSGLLAADVGDISVLLLLPLLPARCRQS